MISYVHHIVSLLVQVVHMRDTGLEEYGEQKYWTFHIPAQASGKVTL